jgi:hypothetical protein
MENREKKLKGKNRCSEKGRGGDGEIRRMKRKMKEENLTKEEE